MECLLFADPRDKGAQEERWKHKENVPLHILLAFGGRQDISLCVCMYIYTLYYM